MLLVNFIKEHKDNWREVLTSSPYNLIIKDGEGIYSGLSLFKYNQYDSDLSVPLVQECRGVIIDIEDNFNVVCYPFNKFFNYGEPNASDIDWNTARVQEKIDGSIIKLWNWRRKCLWIVSTNGAIDAFSVKCTSISGTYVNQVETTFGELFFTELLKHIYTQELDPDCTYMFELVSPYNQVVVNYPKTDIYHIGTRNNITYEEVDMDIGIKKPKTYPLHSLDAVLKASEALNHNDSNTVENEGFVVVDKNWNRIKIKSPLYLQSHYLKGNGLTFKRCLEIYMSNEMDEYLSYFPEQKEAFDTLGLTVIKLEQLLENGWDYIHDNYPDINRKEFAKLMFGSVGGNKFEWSVYYFKKLDNTEITPHLFLFGGYKYIDSKTGEQKETAPMNGLTDKLKYYVDNYSNEECWNF